MRLAIHILRPARSGCPPELLDSHIVHGDLDQVRREAIARLWRYPGVDQDDFVLVRRATDGQELFRWHLREADSEDCSVMELSEHRATCLSSDASTDRPAQTALFREAPPVV